MKKLFLLCILLVIMYTACKKDNPQPTRAATVIPAPFHWNGLLYCASFYQASTHDTMCKKVVSRAQFDSMAYNYGAHIYCTYPNNTGISVSGKQINDSSACH